jgi:tetraprenyl-beta-curcumene synthase
MSSPPTFAAAPVPRPWSSQRENGLHPSEALDAGTSLRAGTALLLANARYWSNVAPLVRQQLRHWHSRAETISDPTLRTLALEKLEEEGFNAEVAATLATIAPRPHRRRVVKAIVALEVLFDYLDGLTESPSRESPGDGERLFEAFIDAVSPSARRTGDYYRNHPRWDSSGYLEELVGTVRFALASLPNVPEMGGILQSAARRSAEAQLRIHSIPLEGLDGVERWASARASGTALEWREFLAGAASSVLCVHALIAAAADHRTTRADGLELDRAYLSISVLPTVLDSLIDYERDLAAGRPGYVRLYEDPKVLQKRLTRTIADALRRARSVPNGPHHVMTIVGIVAYYSSAPTAAGEFACATTERTVACLKPLMAPTMAVMHSWRIAKRVHHRLHLRPAPRPHLTR